MAGKKYKFRFAVGSLDGPRSIVWGIVAQKSEVYAFHRSHSGIHKLSFHTPTDCRYAFTKEHGRPFGRPNRDIHVWQRGITPPAGSNQITCVLRIGITTDNLSTKLRDIPPANTHWITPAPSKESTVIDLFYTNDDEATLRRALETYPPSIQHKLHVYRQLPNGEAICVSSWNSEEGDTVLRVKAAAHDPRDLLILPDDKSDTGRPVRFSVLSNPKDGDLMSVWEWGGFWNAPLTDAEWDEMRRPYMAHV